MIIVATYHIFVQKKNHIHNGVDCDKHGEFYCTVVTEAPSCYGETFG